MVEKFFAGLARKKIKSLFQARDRRSSNLPYNEVQLFHDWLDSHIEGQAEVFAAVQAETANAGTTANATQMHAEETPAPAQVETQVGMDVALMGVFNGNPPPEVREAKAYADKFNWLYKWFTGIHQLSTANPHIASLAGYVEILSVASMLKNEIMVRARDRSLNFTVLNKLGEVQGDAVSAMLDDVQNMSYRTAAEIAAGTARQPTLQELQALAAKHKVTPDGFNVFVEVGKTFQEHLQRIEAMLRADANKITNPVQAQINNARITKQMQNLRSRPYFPAIRFGNYTITIRNAVGTVIHFETFEKERIRDRAADVIRSKLATGDQMQVGFLDKEARPLLGVPSPLLDRIANKAPICHRVQRDALETVEV